MISSRMRHNLRPCAAFCVQIQGVERLFDLLIARYGDRPDARRQIAILFSFLDTYVAHNHTSCLASARHARLRPAEMSCGRVATGAWPDRLVAIVSGRHRYQPVQSISELLAQTDNAGITSFKVISG